ncbi:MAG: DUF1236 domain-containing protein [Pseudomonadota bacterium]|nr:DUF1236 domain-containing protein [Pseudomonadota bacterium]
MKTPMLRITAIALALLATAGLAMAQQDSKPASGPTPDQSGADSSMAAPQPAPGQPASAGGMPSGPATVNAPPKIPSAQNDTAQFNPAVAEKDKQPTVAWTLGLNDEKNRALLQTILGEKAATPASGNPAKVEGVTPAPGERVPASVALNPLPGGAASQMPNAQQYRLARLGSDVLLVDPNTRAIIAVLKN